MATANATFKGKAELDATQFVKGAKQVESAGVNAAEEIKKKNNELVKSYITMLSPVALVIGAVAKLTAAYKELADEGKKIGEEAEKLGVTRYQFAAMKSAADAAKVGVTEFNKAMEDVKAGKKTVEELTISWGKLADKTKLYAEETKNAAAIAAERGGRTIPKLWNKSAQGWAIALNPGEFVRARMEQDIAASGGKIGAYNLSENSKGYAKGLFTRALSSDEAQKMIDAYNAEKARQDAVSKEKRDLERAKEIGGYVKSAGGDESKARALFIGIGGLADEFDRLLPKYREIETESEKYAKALKDAGEAARAEEEARKRAEEAAKKEAEMIKNWVDKAGGIDRAVEIRRRVAGLTNEEEARMRRIAAENPLTEKERVDRAISKDVGDEKKITDARKKAADDIDKLTVAMPKAFGLNEAGGDLLGGNRVNTNWAKILGEKKVRLEEMQVELLKKIEEILAGDS